MAQLFTEEEKQLLSRVVFDIELALEEMPPPYLKNIWQDPHTWKRILWQDAKYISKLVRGKTENSKIYAYYCKSDCPKQRFCGRNVCNHPDEQIDEHRKLTFDPEKCDYFEEKCGNDPATALRMIAEVDE